MNMEAMAAGKPVVATCFGGSREIVLDGETGYIVNPFNVEMMADRIVSLLLDNKKCKQMGESGYHRVTEHFTIKHSAQKYLDLFSEVMDTQQSS
jgi:spore coat protein SA